MKVFIVIAVVALAISTIGAGASAPPQGIRFGISDVTIGKQNTALPDGGSGDFLVVDGYREYKAPDGVIDSTEPNQIDFPQYSRFH